MIMTEQEMAKLPKYDDVIEQYEGNVMDEKERFLSSLPKEMRVIVEKRLKKKEQEKSENKSKAKQLAEITKEMLEGDYIDLGDDTNLSVSELLISKVMYNALTSNKTSFKDLNDAQRVVDNNTSEGKNGFTLVLNYNGQDLGD